MNSVPTRFAWHVAADHPAFAGHFPDMPILPGVVLLDVVARDFMSRGLSARHGLEVRSAKFLAPARPGERLLVEQHVLPGGIIRYEIFAGKRKIAVGDLISHGPIETP
jgi:3-hydroxyacyl-[acyl-carrier-protein] dehydratase